MQLVNDGFKLWEGLPADNHYLTSYLLAIASKYTYVGAGNLLHVCTLKGGGAVLPAIVMA